MPLVLNICMDITAGMAHIHDLDIIHGRLHGGLATGLSLAGSTPVGRQPTGVISGTQVEIALSPDCPAQQRGFQAPPYGCWSFWETCMEASYMYLCRTA
jgi:hypothetical protein